jgi:hypothetical protein
VLAAAAEERRQQQQGTSRVLGAAAAAAVVEQQQQGSGRVSAAAAVVQQQVCMFSSIPRGLICLCCAWCAVVAHAVVSCLSSFGEAIMPECCCLQGAQQLAPVIKYSHQDMFSCTVHPISQAVMCILVAAGAAGSIVVPPATGEQLTAALLQLLEGADLNRVSYKQLHQQLEAKFQVSRGYSHTRKSAAQHAVSSVPD